MEASSSPYYSRFSTDHISITSSTADEIPDTDSFISNSSFASSETSITSSTADKILDTDSFIYNPSFASSETSIASYKTERTVNSCNTYYNTLPRPKHAGIGPPNNLGVDGTKIESDQHPSASIPLVDVAPSQAVLNPTLTKILIDSAASTDSETLRQVGTELKPKIITLVEHMYNFNTSQAPASIIYNATRTRELLRDMNFIYPEPRTGRNPYRHPIIQRVINSTWFRNEDDIGVVDHEHFSPMPIPIITITLAVIEWCIVDWASGTRLDSNWDDAKFQIVYDSHVSSFQARSAASMYQLQCDLLRNAREHAGVLIMNYTNNPGVKVPHFKFQANQRPSQDDMRLDDARDLASKNEEIIDPNDMEIVRERIILAREIKAGLDSKSGLSRYLQAREYRKATEETLKFVKTVSDRARDAKFGHNSAIPGQHAVPIQRPRGIVPHVDAVPLQETAQIPIQSDSEATREARFYYSTDPLPTSIYVNSVHSDSRTTSIRKQLGAEMKPKVTTLVENMYSFKTTQAHSSISYNARRAQVLLKRMNFVYPEPRTGRDPYRHPIIQRVIDTTWFRDKDDVGVVDHEHFSPMPITIIALTLMVIECCIDEWSSGTRRDSSWDDVKFQTVYDSHISSLLDFQAHSHSDLLYELQCDLLRNAREHAGVTPNPTGSSSGALDAVREEDIQPSLVAPSDYDDVTPRIANDSA